jgi:L,D-transpeptidase ErfK/SrfK
MCICRTRARRWWSRSSLSCPHGAQGIVINVAEMRLYYYPPLAQRLKFCQLALASRTRNPRNWVTAVERKQEAPTWTPTANTRRVNAPEGESLPALVPQGG